MSAITKRNPVARRLLIFVKGSEWKTLGRLRDSKREFERREVFLLPAVQHGSSSVTEVGAENAS